MIHERIARYPGLVLAAALALALVVLPGCSGKPAATAPQGMTAKAALPIARSALSTTAPDAKLLLVQTAQAVTPTSTPVWAYLFGSPKSDKTYVVYVDKGKASPASEYSKAGLSKTEWAAVPGTDEWKVDSDQAYSKAFTASGGKGVPAAWGMGFVTYIPKAAGATTEKTFVWSVMFQPGASGATTGTIQVDAKTGAVTGPK
jgi:hypothetical protein